MQLVVKRVFELALGTAVTAVVWGVSDSPRPTRPYARLDVLSADFRPAVRHETLAIRTNSKYEIAFPVPAPGLEYLLRVNGTPHRYTAQVSDTTEADLRDAFIALVNGDAEPVTAAVFSATKLVLEEDAPSSLWGVQPQAPITRAVAGDSAEGCALLHSERSRVTLSLQFFTESAKLSSGAQSLMGRAIMVLDLNSTMEILEDERIVLRDISDATNITGLSAGGPRYEGRSNIDLEAIITSAYAEPISEIEFVEASLVINGDTIPIDIPA
jgi:hypothetical protein